MTGAVLIGHDRGSGQPLGSVRLPAVPVPVTSATSASPGRPPTHAPTPPTATPPASDPTAAKLPGASQITPAPADSFRDAVGAAVVSNPNVRVSPAARSALLAGLVDARLSAVLAAVAAQIPLTLGTFSGVATDPPGTPLRQVVVTPTDPAAVAELRAAVNGQTGEYLTGIAAEGTDGLLVRLESPGVP